MVPFHGDDDNDDEDRGRGHVGDQTVRTLGIIQPHPQFEIWSSLLQHVIWIKCERQQNQHKMASLQSDMNSHTSEKCY